MALLTMIEFAWLRAGNVLRYLLQDPGVSRRIDIAFAVLMLASVAPALLV